MKLQSFFQNHQWRVGSCPMAIVVLLSPCTLENFWGVYTARKLAYWPLVKQCLQNFGTRNVWKVLLWTVKMASVATCVESTTVAEASDLFVSNLFSKLFFSKPYQSITLEYLRSRLQTSTIDRKLERDILNISVQGIGLTVQMWSEKTSVSVMVRTLEAVDLCTPGNRFPRILAPWVLPWPYSEMKLSCSRVTNNFYVLSFHEQDC